MDPAGYRLYRRLKGTPFGTRPLATTTAASYTDTPPQTGETYYYEVRARDRAGNESAGTADQGVTTSDSASPAPVTGVTAEGTTAGNALRRQSSADAEHYEVWAAPDGEADPDGPDTVSGTSYNDASATPGTTVTYRVRAVDASGNVSAESAPVAVARPRPGDSAAPTGVSGTPRDDATDVTWDYAAEGAQYGYRVYRRTTASAAWSRLSDSATTAERFTDTGAPGASADYYVVTLDARGQESAPSAVVTVHRETPATSTAPAPPVIALSAPYTECAADDCVAHGGSGVPLTVTLTHDRLVSGYTYRFMSDGDGYRTVSGPTVTWTPPGPGFYVFEVRTLDRYGRPGPFASIEFRVG
ncbi:hypothetical protein ACFVY4_12625 [Streptomyces sp. NPDC058299]|uniref:hypothetical protein n=1 Tax=Streptomyces sp. NPDC058299 TaxID=3346435 RepID=UPI0036E14175